MRVLTVHGTHAPLNGRHRLNGIDDQVDDDLLKLDWIAMIGRQVCGEIQPQRCPMTRRLVPDQRHHFLDQVIEVEQALLGPGLADQRADPLNDFARALAVADHVPDRRLHFVKPRDIAIEPAQAGLAMRHDRGKRLIDLVRDGGGNRTQAGDTRDMGNLRLRLMQPDFSLPAQP